MLQVKGNVYDTATSAGMEPPPSLRFPRRNETWILCTCIMPDIAICNLNA